MAKHDNINGIQGHNPAHKELFSFTEPFFSAGLQLQVSIRNKNVIFLQPFPAKYLQ